ncbi:Alanine racemase, biosynthetic [Pseudovibrio axinellae]|uniref:Alanine racemase n=1 Tax=Pseudovibrio axinellae TaxID=989403 RepID=A0A165UKW9_9HYPH|nr:alanine racemase [Pseudovibrio axinellae]KZL12485.1 Alanine racemase, biosynthetic [Pseudovibrio axinellae]SEP70185.1 alanine racemase [Pseudovibrio axinellae]
MTHTATPSPNRFSVTAGGAAELTIDLAALQSNWSYIKGKLEGGCECAAVVKANAYGLGAAEVGRALYEAGARVFFVALPEEGIELRAELPQVEIYVLNGLFHGREKLYHDFDLKPVLGSLDEAAEWSSFAQSLHKELPAALQFDTGMHRLGMSADDASTLHGSAHLLKGIKVDLVMSHLACADTPQVSLNEEQLSSFMEVCAKFPGIRKSLSNSAGIFLGSEYHFDMVRPGIALYGGNPVPGEHNPMRPVVYVQAEIIGLRHVPKGKSVGYGASRVAQRNSRIATINAGYADGLHRRVGSSDIAPDGARVFIGGHFAPLFGRVSMDMIAVDVTDIPKEHLSRGAPVEIMGAHVSVDDLANFAQTIPYELLCSLGARYTRRYKR